MYQKRAKDWLKHGDFMLLNLLCLQMAFVLAYWVRHGFRNPYEDLTYRNIALIMAGLDIIVTFFFGSLKNVLKRGYWKGFAATVRHVCLLELFSAFYLFATQGGAIYSRITIVLTGFFYIAFSYLARVLWKHFLLRRMKQEGKRSLLIVSTSERAGKILKNLRSNNYERFYIAGIAVIDRDQKGEWMDQVQVVADRNDVAEYVSREWIDEVFMEIPETDPLEEELDEKFSEMGVVVHLKLVSSVNLTNQKRFVERIGNYTVLTSSINYATPGQLFLKRSLDVAGGFTGCVITAILFVILAPMIYIQSPGPVFFSQVRVGKNGRKFKIYKFRSMYMDAEEKKKALMDQNRVKDGMMFKLDWDPRIIGSRKLPDGTTRKGIGNYIRDWSLDEFPQFFNVLKGDMSLVGTRPPTVDEWEKYELHHRARLAIKPGITGMWQVSGRSEITDFDQVVKLDTEYIRNWSFGLDIRIILKTILVVFTHKGAM